MHTLWWTIILVAMALGLIGTFVPLLPDTPLIVAAAVLHHFLLAPHGASWPTLITLTLLMLCSLALDLISGSLGARHFGATRWGAAGGIIGSIVGLFFGIPGLFLGPLAGVLLGELLGGKGLLPATRSTWGTLLGTLAGTVAKFLIASAMIAWFLLATWPRHS